LVDGLVTMGGDLAFAAASEVVNEDYHLTEDEREVRAERRKAEGERKLSEQFWKVEVERYKQDLRLAHTQDYEPYQAAISIKKKRGRTTGSEKEEKD